MVLDPETCYRAIAARDRRFDGVFFVGVTTTGVYCRPGCPARTPRRDRCVFFTHAAEAERDGFRACLRCRPELAPGSAPMDSVPRLVSVALAQIERGRLNTGSVEDMAADLGVTSRYLRRAVTAALGVSPVVLAQSRRLALAKQLLQDTALPMTTVAFSAGFASIRRFNAGFRARFGCSPSALRRARPDGREDGIVLRLDYRPPLDWRALLAFLGPRATPGVELVDGDVYARCFVEGEYTGVVRVWHDAEHACLRAEVPLSIAPALMPVASRLRALFDLDAHPASIDGLLADEALMRRLVRARPGVRVPGALDGFEVALRAVLGQQVTVAGATTLAGRIAAEYGQPVADPQPGLTRGPPQAEALADAGAAAIARVAGIPLARATAVVELARAVARGSIVLERSADPEAVMRGLEELPGIGPWTARYVAMRALGWPDAFPESDLGLRRVLGVARPRDALERAEAWRPWRAYAAVRLWIQGAGQDLTSSRRTAGARAAGARHRSPNAHRR